MAALARTGRAIAATALACCCILFSLASGAGARAEERILDFASHVAIHPDASIEVTERIQVSVEGDVVKHGILRDIPTRYRDKRGLAVTVDLAVEDVKRDGRDEPYIIEGLENGRRIRIGDKDVFLPHRSTTYEIRYRATRELGFFADFDELYWNVTGNGWTFPIDQASVVIDLPPGASIESTSAYTGPSGAQGRDFLIESSTGPRFAARTTESLSPYDGFTVAVSWPTGFVAPPTDAQRALWFFRDNAPATVAWLGLLAVGGYYYRAWSKVGRDPAPGVIVPLFRPPDGLTPAGSRYVREQGFDDKTFSAALIGLAVKGRLKIAEEGGSFRLIPQPKVGSNLSPGEAKMSVALGETPLALVQTNYARIAAARKALMQDLASTYQGSAFVLNRSWFLAGAAMSIAVLGATYFLASADLASGLVAAGFFIVWWGFIIASASGAIGRLADARGFAFVRQLFGLVFLVPFVVVGLVVPFVAFGTGTLSGDLVAAACAAGLLALVNVVFFWLLSAPTQAGRALLDKIEGFRMYLATTEEDRLNVLNPPDKTPELFERYLPFALALGCAHEWSAKFTDILAAAGVAAPAWYSGTSWDPSHPARFASGLGDTLATSAAAAASPPGSSSGSGGGGSSGGGGGGGGGSGW